MLYFGARSCLSIVLSAAFSVSGLFAQSADRTKHDGFAIGAPAAKMYKAKVKSLQPLYAGMVYAPELRVPQDALQQFRDGVKVYNAGKFFEAEQYLRNACTLYPKYSSAFAAWAMALMKLSHFTEAYEAVDKALELNSNNVDAVRILGILYFHQERFDEAEFPLRRVAEVLPHDARANVVLAAIALVRKDYIGVIQNTDRILSKDLMQYPVIYLLRGDAFEMLGKSNEALNSFQTYIRIAGYTDFNGEKAKAAIARLTLRSGR